MKRAGARAMHVPAFAQTASDRYTMNGVKTMFKRLLALLLLAGFLGGWNTTEGAGKDIPRGGEKLQDSAGKKKKRTRGTPGHRLNHPCLSPDFFFHFCTS